MNDEFRKELEAVINRHSMENSCNTPDFILATFDKSVERWHGRTTHLITDEPLPPTTDS